MIQQQPNHPPSQPPRSQEQENKLAALLRQWRKLKAEYAHLHNARLTLRQSKEARYEAALRIVAIHRDELPQLSRDIDAVRAGKLLTPLAEEDVSLTIAKVLRRLITVTSHVSKHKKSGNATLLEKYKLEQQELRAMLAKMQP